MKRRTPDHPKMVDLCKVLRIEIYSANGIMERLWHFTAGYAPQGDIGKFSDEAIARAAGWKKDPLVLVQALTSTKFLDKNSLHRLVVHDWHDHADDSTRKSLKRLGLNFLSVNENLSGSCPDISGNSPDKNRLPLPFPSIPKPVPPPDAAIVTQPHLPIDEWVERLYGRHPKKRGKPLVEAACLKILTSCRSDGRDPLALFLEIDRIHARWCASEDWTKENAKYCPQLAVWLSDEGWTAGPPARASPVPPERIWSDLPSFKGFEKTPE